MRYMRNIERVFFESADLGGGGGGGGLGDGGGGGGNDVTSAITSSIEGLPGREAPVQPQQAQRTPEEEAEEKELATIQQELLTKNPQLRGRIDIHRHQAVLTRNRNLHAKEVEGWTAKEKAWAEEKAKYETSGKEWQQYAWAKDPDVQLQLRALQLADRDPKAFAELILTDPRFAELLQLKEAKAAVQAAVGGDMPKPNKQEGELSYYDDEGVKSLLDWHKQGVLTESEARHKKDMEALRQEMQSQYGDVAAAYKAHNVWNGALQEQKTRLDGMRKDWKGFQKYEKDIKAVMEQRMAERQADPRLPLISPEEAYIRVVPAKLEAEAQLAAQQAQDKMIADAKEKQAAAGGAVRSTGVERAGEKGEQSIADVIRASIAHIRE